MQSRRDWLTRVGERRTCIRRLAAAVQVRDDGHWDQGLEIISGRRDLCESSRSGEQSDMGGGKSLSRFSVSRLEQLGGKVATAISKTGQTGEL